MTTKPLRHRDWNPQRQPSPNQIRPIHLTKSEQLRASGILAPTRARAVSYAANIRNPPPTGRIRAQSAALPMARHSSGPATHHRRGPDQPPDPPLSRRAVRLHLPPTPAVPLPLTAPPPLQRPRHRPHSLAMVYRPCQATRPQIRPYPERTHRALPQRRTMVSGSVPLPPL